MPPSSTDLLQAAQPLLSLVQMYFPIYPLVALEKIINRELLNAGLLNKRHKFFCIPDIIKVFVVAGLVFEFRMRFNGFF